MVIIPGRSKSVSTASNLLQVAISPELPIKPPIVCSMVGPTMKHPARYLPAIAALIAQQDGEQAPDTSIEANLDRL